MKKIIILTICIIFTAIFLTGCITLTFSPGMGLGVTGKGSPEAFTFDVNDVNEIKVELLCNIEYHYAPSASVSFQVQPNLMEYITIKESGGVLTVRSNRSLNITGSANTPVLIVSSPSLQSVSHAGAGKFTAFDPISGNNFSLNITGAAGGSAELDVSSLLVNITGAGDIKLSGSAVNADITTAGAGKLNALELRTNTASVNMVGVGTVSIDCSNNLNVIAGGVGTVEYRGSPSLNITRGGIVTVRQVD